MSERIGRAVLELGAEPSGLFRTFDQAKAGSRSTEAEFEKLRRRSQQLGDDLTKAVTRFEGRPLIDEARTMAQAIDQVGGVSKLTKRELADVASVVRDATDKLARMGEEVPPSIRKLETEIKALDASGGRAASGGLGSLTSALGGLGPLLPALSLAGAVGFATRLAGEALDASDQIVKISNRLEVSIGTVQEWQYVAGQTSTTVEAFGANANKLSINIANGSKKVRDGLHDIGLSYAELRNLKPEDQFNRVAEALEGVDNVNERNRIGTALFGKQFTEIASAIAEGYTKMRREATKAGDDHVRAAEAAGDAWEKAKQRIGAAAINILGRFAQELQDKPFDVDQLNVEQMQQYTVLLRSGGDAYGYLLGLERERVKGMRDISLSTAAAAGANLDYVKALAAARTEIAGLKPDQLTQLNAAIAIGGDAATEFAARIGLSDEALRLYTGQAKEGTKAGTDLKEIQDALFGQEAIKRGQQYADALGDVSNLTKLTTEKKAELHTAVLAALEAYKQLGQQAPQKLKAIEAATRPVLEATRTMSTVLPKAVRSTEEAANALGESIHNIPTETIHEAAQATSEADAAMRAWAQTTGAVYPAAAKRASAATHEIAESAYDAYESLALMFAQLGQISGSEGLTGVMRAIGTMVVGLQAASRQSKLVGRDGQTLGGQFGTLSTVFNKNATSSQRMAAGLSAAAGIASGAVNVWNATGQSASKMKNALSGAMAGAQAGAMFGPWGIAIGAAAGLVVGLVRGKPAWAQAAKEVGRDFGVEISKELGQKIADLAKKEFHGNRQAAAVASLSDIIKEAGGLNAGNLGQMTARLRDVFALFEAGQMTAAQATKVLDENFAAFVEAGTDGAGHLSEGLKEIIRLQQRMGIESKAVKQYLQQQSSVAIAGANAVIAAGSTQYEQWQKVADAVKDAEKARRDALADGSANANGDSSQRDTLARLDKDLATNQAALAALRANAGQYKQELDDLSLIAAGSYYAAIKAGKSHAEAIREAGPGLAQLKAAYENLGLEVEDAGTRSLMLQADLQQRAPQLIAGVDGLTASFVALDNMGRMNAETFAAMQRRGTELFHRIQGELAAAGADMSTNIEALIPMQDYLHEAARQAELLGIPLDENTQSLIDQSKELGIWGDKGEKGAGTVQEGLQSVVDVLKEIKDALLGIPPEVRTRVVTDHVDTGSDERYHGEETPGFRRGVFRGRFDAAGTLARLHDVESVVPRDREVGFAARVLADRGLGVSSATTTTTNTLPMPLLMVRNEAPAEIGRKVARWMVRSGLPLDVEGSRSTIETIVRDVMRTYATAR